MIDRMLQLIATHQLAAAKTVDRFCCDSSPPIGETSRIFDRIPVQPGEHSMQPWKASGVDQGIRAIEVS